MLRRWCGNFWILNTVRLSLDVCRMFVLFLAAIAFDAAFRNSKAMWNRAIKGADIDHRKSTPSRHTILSEPLTWHKGLMRMYMVHDFEAQWVLPTVTWSPRLLCFKGLSLGCHNSSIYQTCSSNRTIACHVFRIDRAIQVQSPSANHKGRAISMLDSLFFMKLTFY